MLKKRKKRAKKIDFNMKKRIAAEYLITGSIPEVAKKFDYSDSAIENVIYKNLNLKGRVKEKLRENMETTAGIVGTAALETLKEKDLSKEKVSTLSTLSSEMYKINRGDGAGVPIQVTIGMPVSRESLLDYLFPSANIVESAKNVPNNDILNPDNKANALNNEEEVKNNLT